MDPAEPLPLRLTALPTPTLLHLRPEGDFENNPSKHKAHSLKDCSWLPTALKIKAQGTSLVVQWLKLRIPITRDPGSIPGQGTRSHMPQLKILRVTTETRCG